MIEFDRIIKESPNSALGIQSLWRASMTRALFLKEYSEALKGLQAYVELSAKKELIKEALMVIGEIFYLQTQQYQLAIDHYQKLIDSKKFNSKEEGFFYFRISRSYIALGKIIKAIETEKKILTSFDDFQLINKIRLDLAQNWYSIGDIDKNAYGNAIKLYSTVAEATKNADKKRYIEAQFGKAVVLEELEKFDEALRIYQEIEKEDAVSNIIKARMKRIHARIERKKV